MAIAPINVARVSNNLRAFNTLRTVQSGQLELFRRQTQIATGLKFLAPSEDPGGAKAVSRLDQRLDVLRQVETNLQQANAVLREGETAMSSAVEKIREAQSLAIQTTGDTLSSEERKALMVVVEDLVDSLVSLGNRAYLDQYLFSGFRAGQAPFEWTADGVIFRGDAGRLQTILDSDLSESTFTISGQDFFNAVSDGVQGFVDLDPQLTADTRLSDLAGATGRGITGGRLVISSGGVDTLVDLTDADTVGDVIDRLNADLPAGFSASIAGDAIAINAASSFTVTDIGGGSAAVELGIYTNTPVGTVLGDDLDPRVTLRSRLSDLMGGAGVALGGGITLRNGARVANVDFSGAETIEDVLNRINRSDAGVVARIAPDGKTLEVRNRISGAPLTIAENGGADATLLGIRSMHPEVRLADLNDGRGIQTVDGDDFRITTADGTQVDVDLDDLDLNTATLQDLLDLINAAGAGALTADLPPSGNGLRLTDLTAGGGTLTIEPLNASSALGDLGLRSVTATGNQLIGTDVNPVIVDSPFTALLELRAALNADDSRAIGLAAGRLEGNLEQMLRVQGQLASTARTMLDRSERVEDETAATEILRSDVRDVDITEALVRFQQVQTALQANLQTSSQILNLSLLDYLR